MATTNKQTYFKASLTADTVADWLRASGYRFKPGTPKKGKQYTSKLPAITGKIPGNFFDVVV